MEQLIDLWNLILKSNTFNFAVLVVILVIVGQKLKVGEMLDKMRLDIISGLEDSKTARKLAEEKLVWARLKVKNIESEISEKFKNSESRAEKLAESIGDAAKRRVRQIEDNAERVIAAEEKNIKSELGRKTAADAVELAKNLVKTRLQQNPKLHDRYIDESIAQLDKVRF